MVLTYTTVNNENADEQIFHIDLVPYPSSQSNVTANLQKK